MVDAAKFALLSLASAALHLPVSKVYNKTPLLAKRAHYTDVILGNTISFYAELEVGTPPQKQSVIVDTGSSDLWFATPATCNTDANGNAPDGSEPIPCDNVFDYTKSSSLVNTTNPFEIEYADQSTSKGFYVQDTVSIAGATVEAANIAYADEASAPSIMGIGYNTNEACVNYAFSKADNGSTIVIAPNSPCRPYDNLPIQLKKQGKISSTAYSLWLNDLNTAKGNLLFGGVDHKKYMGQLVSLPIDKSPNGYSYPPPNGKVLSTYVDYNVIQVTLNEVKVIADNGQSEILLSGAIPAILDTGSTECSLPSALLNSLATALDVVFEGNDYYVNCGVGDKVYIALNFRGLEIQVPLKQFLRPESTFNGDYIKFGEEGTLYCRLGGSVDDESSVVLLGDNVLSSFYTVVDLERNEVALAPALFEQYDTDVEDIVDTIPRAVQAPAYSHSFSSHLIINPTPTLDLDVTSVTSVYGVTGPFVSAPVTEAADANHPATVNGVQMNRVPLVVHQRVGKDEGANATSRVYSYGITNIIELDAPTGLPDGIDSVYSAGAPSTLSVGSVNATTTGYNGTTGTAGTAGTAGTTGTTGTAGIVTGTATGFTNSTISGSASGSAATTSGPASGSANGAGATTVTSKVTVLTTYCPEPTTFTWGHSVYTVTEATTLTVTSCPPEERISASKQGNGPGPVINPVATETETTTVFTTYCPEPTTFTWGKSTYVVTKATTLTITSCPPESETSAKATTFAASTPIVPINNGTASTPPAEVTGAPSTIASNGAVQASLCGALLLAALL